MNLEELQPLLTGDPENYAKAVTEITRLKTAMQEAVDTALTQYEITGHEVMDKVKRKDKTVNKLNDSGAEEFDRLELVARLGLSFQKIITTRAAAFLCANPIDLIATPKDSSEETILSAIQKVWDDNKLDYKSMEIAEKMMCETEVAELWYSEKLAPDDNYWEGVLTGAVKLRMRVLANSLGDKIYPVFDKFTDMIAFGRWYSVALTEGKQEEHFDIYTAKTNYFATKMQDGWDVKSEINFLQKIPVIYYCQPKPEWQDVQTLIDRLEKKISNHADTNDYFDSPIIFVNGTLQGMASKGDNGRILIGDENAKAMYLAWDNAPESTKMEIDNLLRFIYSLTDTPDISFENLKGLGTTSGFALEMMFMGAHLKAAKKAGLFGEPIQRRINLLKGCMAIIDKTLRDATKLKIKPKFEFFLPKDIESAINTLSVATGNKPIMSQKTAVALNPLVEDKEAEQKQVEADTAAAANIINLGGN